MSLADEQRQSDMETLEALLEHADAEDDGAVPDAFEDIHQKLVAGVMLVLTPKQRVWVNAVATKVGVVPRTTGRRNQCGSRRGRSRAARRSRSTRGRAR